MARGFNIDNFKAAVMPKGILRPNRYLVEFQLPAGFLNVPEFQSLVETARWLEYWCEGANLPGYGLMTHEIRRYGYGPLEKRPMAPTFTDITLTFLSDGKGDVWRLMKEWMELVVNKKANQGMTTRDGRVSSGGIGGSVVAYDAYELTYRTEYVADIKIYVYDMEGRIAKIVTLREAYPITMSDVALSWLDNNSLMRLPVSFTFIDWFEETPSPEEQDNF